MSLALLHRRLAVLMGLAGLLAFAAGAGFEPVSSALALIALVVALFWHPSQHTSVRMEPVWLPVIMASRSESKIRFLRSAKSLNRSMICSISSSGSS